VILLIGENFQSVSISSIYPGPEKGGKRRLAYRGSEVSICWEGGRKGNGSVKKSSGEAGIVCSSFPVSRKT